MRRLLWVDAGKGALMLLVILGHSIIRSLGHDGANDNHIYNMIYSFHMPAFFFISGWLMYREGSTIVISDAIKRRTFQLLCPYILWSLIRFVYGVLLVGYGGMYSLLLIIIKPDSYFWFLWTLYFVSIIFSIVCWLSQKYHQNENFFIIFLSLLLVLCMILYNFKIFGFQFIAYYFIFYSFGYFVRKYPIFINFNNYVLFFYSAIWFFLAWNWKMHELPNWFPTFNISPQLLQFLYRGMTAFLGSIVFLRVSQSIFTKTNMVVTLLQKIGIVSLGIYVIHFFFMDHIRDVFIYKMPNINVMLNTFLIASISLLISLVIIFLLRRNKHTNKYLLGKV